MYIDGKWCEADNRRTLGVINPATEEVIEEIDPARRTRMLRKVLPFAIELASGVPLGATR